MLDIVNMLKGINIFADFTLEELKKIASILEFTNIKSGEVLYRRNEPAHTLYIVLSGSYMVYYNQEKAIVLNKKGDAIGWSTLLSPFKYKGTGVALTDGETLSMESSKLFAIIRDNAELGSKIMKKLNEIIEKRAYVMKDF